MSLFEGWSVPEFVLFVIGAKTVQIVLTIILIRITPTWVFLWGIVALVGISTLTYKWARASIYAIARIN